MPRIYDITLTIAEDLVAYPGNPAIRVRPHSQISRGDLANVTSLSFGSHTGTHLDAAHHFVDGGQTVDELPIDVLIGPARVVHLPEDVRAIGEAELAPLGLQGEVRVLMRTRNSALLHERSFDETFTYLAPDGAEYLVACGARLVALDYLSVEAFGAKDPRTHRILLEREIIVVEGVDLRDVPEGRYELLCLPLKIAIDGAPLRAVLRTIE